MSDIFFKYNNERIKFTFPFDWSKNPYRVSSFPHHLMSLRWIDDSFTIESIRLVLIDFYNFHFIRNIKHPYYVKIQADHSTCIRLFKLYSIKEIFKNDIELSYMIDNIIYRDLAFLQNKKVYRVGHNHGIMSDSAILFFYNRGYKNGIKLIYILLRSCKTFNKMWNNNGETNEHSIGYQEFNLKQSLIYLKELNFTFEQNKNKLYNNLFLFFKNKLLSQDILKDSSKKFLGFMLTNKNLYFPIGDSIREPSFNLLLDIFNHKNKNNICNIQELLSPYSFMNGSYSSKSYFVYRNNFDNKSLFCNYIHFASTCNWNSDAHKQNDELHFCLQLDDDIIFDDCGYTDFLSSEQYMDLSSEFYHNSITIEDYAYNDRKKTNFKSEIVYSSSNIFGFDICMSHNRIDNCNIKRNIIFNNFYDIFKIKDFISVPDYMIGKYITFNFVLSPE
ncbi:hypothetical protein ITK70_001566, partial [Campylobacter lari]|nr:hypothetical protein [Campylobacter lari]